MSIKTLVINPGSTSTKVGVFEDETLLFEETLRHPTEEIAKYASCHRPEGLPQGDHSGLPEGEKLRPQDPERHRAAAAACSSPSPAAPTPSATPCWTDLKAGVQGQHASNLGGILAREIGDSLGIPSYIVDPVVVDELTDKARICRSCRSCQRRSASSTR